jgi:hypothetical protein
LSYFDPDSSSSDSRDCCSHSYEDSEKAHLGRMNGKPWPRCREMLVAR